MFNNNTCFSYKKFRFSSGVCVMRENLLGSVNFCTLYTYRIQINHIYFTFPGGSAEL